MFSLICAWTNGCVNNREAGDSRRHCAHYDVIVMSDQKVPNIDGGRAPLWLLGNSVSSAHFQVIPLIWRHNGRDGVSNHRRLNCLLSRLFRRRSKKTSKLCVTGLCEGNSPVTGEFPAQRASNEENVSIWWRHHECLRSWLGTEWDANRVSHIQRRLCHTPRIIHTIQYTIYICIYIYIYLTVIKWLPFCRRHGSRKTLEFRIKIQLKFAHHRFQLAILHNLVCRLFGAKPLSEPSIT